MPHAPAEPETVLSIAKPVMSTIGSSTSSARPVYSMSYGPVPHKRSVPAAADPPGEVRTQVSLGAPYPGGCTPVRATSSTQASRAAA